MPFCLELRVLRVHVKTPMAFGIKPSHRGCTPAAWSRTRTRSRAFAAIGQRVLVRYLTMWWRIDIFSPGDQHLGEVSLPFPGSAGIYGRWVHAPFTLPPSIGLGRVTRAVERGIEPRPPEGYALYSQRTDAGGFVRYKGPSPEDRFRQEMHR